jgi:hypothetical protein
LLICSRAVGNSPVAFTNQNLALFTGDHAVTNSGLAHAPDGFAVRKSHPAANHADIAVANSRLAVSVGNLAVQRRRFAVAVGGLAFPKGGFADRKSGLACSKSEHSVSYGTTGYAKNNRPQLWACRTVVWGKKQCQKPAYFVAGAAAGAGVLAWVVVAFRCLR